MITIRPSQDRGRTNIDWLNSYHSFSFGDYYDPSNMGFRSLRAINEDWVKPVAGFGKHPHRDMEIITYVVKGELEHQDSMGNGSVIRAGDVQRMSAGTGILHSEFNPSRTDPVHLLQIWLLPDRRNLKPEYDQQTVSQSAKTGKLKLLASRDGQEGSMKIHQDASLYATHLREGDAIVHPLPKNRHGWLQMICGEIEVNGKILVAGDGASLSDEPEIRVRAKKDSEFLVFDLA
jgi:redox-sensitive bicupin YhaK (pirin superfamily)